VGAFAAAAVVAAGEDCNMGGIGALGHHRVMKEIAVEALETAGIAAVVVAAPSLVHRIEVVVAAVVEVASQDLAQVFAAAAVPTTMTMMPPT